MNTAVTSFPRENAVVYSFLLEKKKKDTVLGFFACLLGWLVGWSWFLKRVQVCLQSAF